MAMKELFLPGIAALLLATGTASAQKWPVTTEIEDLVAMIAYGTTCPFSSIDPRFPEWHTKFLKKLKDDLVSNYPEDQRLAADQKIKGFMQQVTQKRFCEIASEQFKGQQ